MKAIINKKDIQQLKKSANICNNGNTDGTYFYVNDDCEVFVCHPHKEIPLAEQKKQLEWFLNYDSFELIY